MTECEILTELIYGASDKVLSVPYISYDGAEALADYLIAHCVTVTRARWKGAGMGDYDCSYCGFRVSGNQLKECPSCHAIMED